MESVHKPVFIPPKKRVVRKVKGGPSSSAASSVRRIHSYDIVTRIQHDDSNTFAACNAVGTASRLPSSKSGSPADLARSRSQSQETFSLSTLSSSPHLTLCSERVSPVNTAAGASLPESRTRGAADRRVDDDDDSIVVEVGDDDLEDSTIAECVREVETTATTSSPASRPDSAEVEAIELATEKSALNHQSLVLQDGYLTLSGTIKRGKKAGQSIDVKLNMSREELEKMEADLSKKLQPKAAFFGTRSGLHVALLSLLCIPAVFLASGCYVFYLGTFTWYNIYLHYSEERTIWHKIFICPVLVLTYPVWVAPTFLGIGLYAAMVQVSWYYDRWLSEIQDLEKGFFGWLCAALLLSDCAPYEVVILNDIPNENEKVKINERTTTL